ncbi:hypothetical protein HYH03_008369 [Edaphochlamys debaryana]|uniref:Uncharacterized protein n=1 Tax=Edaphochlamys debaryana TaxID=47281 RepID=A0A836BYF6_9CHLO|nr:hypothetical protein HYH03_008369 [Edaphochlamys debaryana]|eukprot:KAG2493555.1 hypothetical protein HYH03_008369 [Edaphochlamys debaryana]
MLLRSAPREATFFGASASAGQASAPDASIPSGAGALAADVEVLVRAIARGDTGGLWPWARRSVLRGSRRASAAASELLKALDRVPDAPAAGSSGRSQAVAWAPGAAAAWADVASAQLTPSTPALSLLLAPASPLAGPLSSNVDSSSRPQAAPAQREVAGPASREPAASEAPSPASQPRLLGPPTTATGPAAAALLCEAAGVPLPPWAAAVLGQQASQAVRFGASSPHGVAPALDPALEWAAGVLSHRVTPTEPSPAALATANRALASQLGPNAGASSSAGPDARRRRQWGRRQQRQQGQQQPFPWPLMLPLLDAVGDRLSAAAALALMKSVALQVGPRWRQTLTPGAAAHLAATLRRLAVLALRRPEALSPPVAAGLLAALAALRLRSLPACALLVERLVGARAPRAARAGSAMAPAAAAEAAVTGQQSAPSSSDAAARTAGEAASSDAKSPASARGRARTAPQPRRRLRLAWSASAPAAAPPLVLGGRRGLAAGADSALEQRRCLAWAATALAALATLRVDGANLPRGAVSRLLATALRCSDVWTPRVASSLLPAAAATACRPSAAQMRSYTAAVLQPRAPAGSSGADVVAPSVEPPKPVPTIRIPLGLKLHGPGSEEPKAESAGDAASKLVPPGSLAACMTGAQLAAALEALAALYPAPTGAAAAAAPAGVGAHQGLPEDLPVALLTALGPRLQSVPRQPLCRLQLALGRLGLAPSKALDSAAAHRWQQVYVARIRALLPRCDAADVMLLLRGLAAEAQAEAREQARSVGSLPPATSTTAWVRTQLADDALRRFVELLPAAGLHHTVSVLTCLPLLRGSQPPPPRAGAAAGPEAALRQRLAAETGVEAGFLLGQLDDHLAACLRAEAARPARAGPGAPGGRAVGGAPTHRMALQALVAYARLRRAPPRQLQAALEAALLRGGSAVGTQGWAAVRRAYAELGLAPGRELGVALLTFG